MIKSILDLDLYKLTVLQIIFHRFINVVVEYAFTCRNAAKVQLTKYITLDELRQEINRLGQLRLSDTEAVYLRKQGYFTEEFVEFLSCFRLNPERYITIGTTPDGLSFTVRAKGPWVWVMMFETLVLSTINALYTRNYCRANNISEEQLYLAARQRFHAKVESVKAYNRSMPRPPRIIEFGTRRRFSFEWQQEALLGLRDQLSANLIGTSNVYLAMQHNLPPIGTFGHEFVMGLQGLYPIQHSQREAFKVWLREYRGMWGTVLPDTLGSAKFYQDFTFELAKAYDGVRQDSGEPTAEGEAIIAMYKGFNIDPMTKRLVFSDGLDFNAMFDLQTKFAHRIITSFGIGTYITNDTGLVPVPQIVMKIVRSHGQPVLKLSNTPGKVSCEDPQFGEYAVATLNHFTSQV